MPRGITNLQSFIMTVEGGQVYGFHPDKHHYPSIFNKGPKELRIWWGHIPTTDVEFPPNDDREGIPMLPLDTTEWTEPQRLHALAYIQDHGIKVKKDVLYEPSTRSRGWVYITTKKDNEDTLVGGTY